MFHLVRLLVLGHLYCCDRGIWVQVIQQGVYSCFYFDYACEIKWSQKLKETIFTSISKSWKKQSILFDQLWTSVLSSNLSTKETPFFAHKILYIKITLSTLYMNFLNHKYLFMPIRLSRLPENSNNTPHIECIRVIIIT